MESSKGVVRDRASMDSVLKSTPGKCDADYSRRMLRLQGYMNADLHVVLEKEAKITDDLRRGMTDI